MSDPGLAGPPVENLIHLAPSPHGRGGFLCHAGLLPWQVSRVRDYVDMDLAGHVSITEAAERARLSAGYFSRCFRQSFGLTFSKFVAQRRIERAKAMMSGSSCSLCQIALACGFADQSHFTRTFTNLTGSSPSHWRRAASRYGRHPAPIVA